MLVYVRGHLSVDMFPGCKKNPLFLGFKDFTRVDGH